MSTEYSITISNYKIVRSLPNEKTFCSSSSVYGSACLRGVRGEETDSTTLTIANQSLATIYNVTWNGVSFTSVFNGNSIAPGGTETKSVSVGGGYVVFTAGSASSAGSASYRTAEVVIAEKNKQTVFTFLSSSVVVSAANPNNPVTLGSL